MATKYVKGQQVKAVGVIPQGPVEKLRMTEDGEFFYFIRWVDAKGVEQFRWFREDQLIEV